MAPTFDRDKTDPGPDPRGAATSQRRTFTALLDLDVAGLSDRGKVRSNNEDHFIISRLGRFLDTLDTNIPADQLPPRFEEATYGMIVADGVGGGAAGEVASQTAIRTLVQLATGAPNWFFRLEEDRFIREMVARLKTRVDQIHEELIRAARVQPDLHGFGTTMTLGLSVGDVLFLAHIGDSRAYLLREGRLQQLTRDHTLLQDLADKGMSAGSDVPAEKLRHVLTQALTDHAGPVEPEVQAVELEDGDRLLLCTDGLTEMVPDDRIAAILGEDGPSRDLARKLVDGALEAGGKDNVTVVVARYRFGGESFPG
jgi:serine/threonine protein phosphatase PrpC